MPVVATLPAPRVSIRISATPLTREGFAAFGDVVQNPRPDLHPSVFSSTGEAGDGRIPHDPVAANQGSAIKYQHVTVPRDLYATGRPPSGQPAAAVANMFVCAARGLEPAGDKDEDNGGGVFAVRILERHPFTSQTFVPLSRGDGAADVRYLVVVAPSLPPSGADGGVPVPVPVPAPVAEPTPTTTTLGGRAPLPGRGLPDLHGMRAFVATGAQAVTYGPGTWHAPMVALGGPRAGGAVDFFVAQFANGVGLEDCQEAVLEGGGGDGAGHDGKGAGGGRVEVRVPGRLLASERGRRRRRRRSARTGVASSKL